MRKLMIFFMLCLPSFSVVITEDLMGQATKVRDLADSTQGSISLYSFNLGLSQRYVVVKKLHNKENVEQTIKAELCAAKTIFKNEDFANTYALLNMDDEIWIVMEPILGVNLRQIFLHSPKEKLDSVFKYYVAVVVKKNSTLEKLRINWGDPHAANVMVDAFTGRVKLIDFGISKKLQDTETSRAFSRIGLYEMEILNHDGNPRWDDLSEDSDRDMALRYLRNPSFDIEVFKKLAWFNNFSFNEIDNNNSLQYFPNSALSEGEKQFYFTIRDKILKPTEVDTFYSSQVFSHIDCSNW